ncbi:MAG: hypothetical protein ACOC07_11940 [Coleofasciculus sp.]
MILSPVEYLHFGGNKAEGFNKAEGRRQKAEGNNYCLGGHDMDNQPKRKSPGQWLNCQGYQTPNVFFGLNIESTGFTD